MLTCNGFGTVAADKPLGPLSFDRRDVGEKDVRIQILFCGVCHSDLRSDVKYRFSIDMASLSV
jgi:uncharacterized zinc-type alcohol dehydrogenase-like protein